MRDQGEFVAEQIDPKNLNKSLSERRWIELLRKETG